MEAEVGISALKMGLKKIKFLLRWTESVLNIRRSYQLRWALVEGGLMITSGPSSSVGFYIFLANLLVRFVIIAFLNYGLRHPMNSVLVPSLVSSRETTVPVRFDLTERVARHLGAQSWHQGIRNIASQTSVWHRHRDLCISAIIDAAQFDVISICNRYDISVFKITFRQEYILDPNSDRQCVNSVEVQIGEVKRLQWSHESKTYLVKW
ncbi:DNA-directed RNA polymerase subunit beta [Trichinella spiralis]|uniref:DNA-directed RNA polymerase subunit beta n=1 Tax=Trichinella spiralis TaxID=6334 RepID=A0ABR3KGZ4_TRISP